MRMRPGLKDQSARKINFMITWQVSGIRKTLGMWFLVRGTLLDMLGDELMVLRVCMVGMELAKETLREENHSSFLMKRVVLWRPYEIQTLDHRCFTEIM